MQLRQIEELAAAAGLPLEHLTGTPHQELMMAVTSLPELPAEIEDWKLAATGGCRELAFLTTLDRALPLVDHVRSRWAGLGVGADFVGTYLQPLNQGRTCHVELSAFVSPAEAPTLDEITSVLVDELIDAEAFFSRPVGAAVAPTFARCGDVVRTLHKVKAVLDPHGVLNPGALCFNPALAAAAFKEVSSS